LLIGSAITALLGGWFGTKWQLQQWRIQQREQRDDADAKEMRQLQAEAAEAVAGSFAAAEDVLHLFSWEWARRSKVTSVEDRGVRWFEASRKWRVSEKVLAARLRSVFGSDTARTFEEIVKKRRQLGNRIIILLSIADVYGSQSKKHRAEIDEASDEALQLINQVTVPGGELTRLITDMERVIRHREEQRRAAPPAINFFSEPKEK
jgi:hypothetical protein